MQGVKGDARKLNGNNDILKMRPQRWAGHPEEYIGYRVRSGIEL